MIASSNHTSLVCAWNLMISLANRPTELKRTMSGIVITNGLVVNGYVWKSEVITGVPHAICTEVHTHWIAEALPFQLQITFELWVALSIYSLFLHTKLLSASYLVQKRQNNIHNAI